MGKKDAILITVLMNCILLFFVFFTGRQSEPLKPSPKEASVALESTKADLSKKEGIDEVDQLLKKLTQTHLLEEKPAVEKVAKLKEEPQKPLEAMPEGEKTIPQDIIVRAGDTLDKIARSYGLSVEEIMRTNHLIDSRLQIGQVLKLTKSSKKGQEKYYTVKNGDNPWTIAMKNQMKVDELLRLNNLDEEKAKRLKPGDQLRIQ
ncbi:LysM peptidoglycan-binding domain-containing protein [bacterium]|jgi:LysM repeat protein|nr:LysM peptidoglycan-binding domain-containing protein [bacterium]